MTLDLIFSILISYLCIGVIANMAIYGDQVGSYGDVLKVIWGWPYYAYRDIRNLIIKIKENMKGKH